MSIHGRSSARRRLAGAAIALCLAVAASASAAEIAVGSLNPQTGKFKVNESVLSQTFADGTPVGTFQIRYFSSMPYDISNGFFLVRSAPPVPGACRTQATRVAVHDNKAWLSISADLPKLVIDCGGPVPACQMCVIRADSDWSCACTAGGSDTGASCLNGATVFDGHAFVLDWLQPI